MIQNIIEIYLYILKNNISILLNHFQNTDSVIIICVHTCTMKALFCVFIIYFLNYFFSVYILHNTCIQNIQLCQCLLFHALNVKYLLHRVLKCKESLLFVLHAYIYSDVFYVYISLILLRYLIYSKTTGTVILHAYINWFMYTCIFFFLHLKYILACKCIYYVAKQYHQYF